MNRADRRRQARSRKPVGEPEFSGICEYVLTAPQAEDEPYWEVERCGAAAAGTIVVTHPAWGFRSESFGFCEAHAQPIFNDLHRDGFIPGRVYRSF